MKAKKFLFSVMVIAILIMNACSDNGMVDEQCTTNEDSLEACVKTCITNPELCVPTDGTLSEVPSDSSRAVSKLPVRE